MQQKNKTQTIVLLLLGLSLLLNATLLLKNKESQTTGYALLDPRIAALEVDEFNKQQTMMNLAYTELKNDITKLFSNYPKDCCSYYYEDLATGAWVGINEKKTYTPGSLLKVPTLAATLKDIEEGKITLQTMITITEEDLDNRYGKLYEKGAGSTYSIQELLEESATNSDNTADNALRKRLDYGEYATAMLGMGLPYTTKITNNIMNVSAKHYSNIFRSLYHSTYTKRSSSQLLLSLLANTNRVTGLQKGVPKEVQISHKFGIWTKTENYHDCGITYTKKGDYLICVMTKGLPQQEADELIEQAAKKTYTQAVLMKEQK